MAERFEQAQLVDINFYKSTGKWYAGGMVAVYHPLADTDNFKQDIVDNQTQLIEGWQTGNYYVVISVPEHVNGFFHHLFVPGSFRPFKKAVRKTDGKGLRLPGT